MFVFIGEFVVSKARGRTMGPKRPVLDAGRVREQLFELSDARARRLRRIHGDAREQL